MNPNHLRLAIRHSIRVFASTLLILALLNGTLSAQNTTRDEAAQLLERLEKAEQNLKNLENQKKRLQPSADDLELPQERTIRSEGKESRENNPDKTRSEGKKRESSTEEKTGDKNLNSEKKVDSSEDKPSADKKKDDDKKKDEKKEKQWYEKYKIRGYTQFRYNDLTNLSPGSARPDHAGDSSVSDDQEIFIRRARVILQGDVSDHLALYFQPDFAVTPDAQTVSNHFVQLRDWYGDIHIDKTKIHRIRIGQSKIPYGWENMQSSSNRLCLDRNDAFNSGARNERDLGAFYYWTPEWAQDTFKVIADEELKGSGNYGVFGFGAYNGQGGSLRERNDELHLISRLTIPRTLDNGQLVEMGIQGYTGRYVVEGAPISPLGIGSAIAPIGTRGRPFGDDGMLDQRLGWTFVYFPQPLGFQAEYTIGRGPELNDAQTALERGSLHGGYVMLNYRHITCNCGQLWPFIRWQHYEGGYKNAINAPSSSINEWNLGVEWQIRKELELVTEYLITDRTNLRAQSSGLSYQQFNGDLLRLQLQINY